MEQGFQDPNFAPISAEMGATFSAVEPVAPWKLKLPSSFEPLWTFLFDQ